jgi:molybdopterin molybdotransferase
LLLALAQRSGYAAFDLGIVRDDPAALERTLTDAAERQLDVVITTGGAAQGDFDIVRGRPNARFIALDIRPGRGIVFSAPRAARQPLLLGLPGNAVAAYVMYQLVARPVLGWMAGARDVTAPRIELPIAIEARGRAGRIEWRRATFVRIGDRTAVQPLVQQGSAMLKTVTEADALVAIGPRPLTPAGESVSVIPLAAIE